MLLFSSVVDDEYLSTRYFISLRFAPVSWPPQWDPLGSYFLLLASCSSYAFCRCLLFQFSVREMLSTQSSLRLSKGSTEGKGKRDAEIVT